MQIARRTRAWLATGVAALAVAVSVLLAAKWPFREARVLASLQKGTGAGVHFDRFRTELLPWPGCTLDGVTFRNAAGGVAARAERVSVRGSWLDLLLLRRRVAEVRGEGLVVHVPHARGLRREKGGEQSTIEELVADGAVVEVVPGFSAVLRRLRVMDLGPGAEPVVDGWFEIRKGALEALAGVRGALAGRGEFSGPLARIRTEGSVAADGFGLRSNPNSMQLAAGYHAAVNARRGDVRLDWVEARFLSTVLTASGEVRDGRVSLAVKGDRVRIEDLLRMFTKAQPPALRGPMTLTASIGLPPGDGAFLRRLRLDGDAVIRNARWSKSRTQAKVNELSARARGGDKEDAGPVVTELRGSVAVRDGVARMSDVSFRVPGASARGGGTFHLLTKDVDLTGRVTMAADVSEATSGIKSVLLKPFSFLFRPKNEKRGAVLPVSVRGRYPRPRFRVGLTR